MAQIILIKNANTIKKHLADYVGCWEDDHLFSEKELLEFTVLQVSGINREELDLYLQQFYTITKRVYKTAIVGEWTDVIEKATAWQDGEDWKLITDVTTTPKYALSFSELTEVDVLYLADPEIEMSVKNLILNKAVSRYKIDPGDGNDTVIDIVKVQK